MSILNIVNQLIAYDDTSETNNPMLKPFDWHRKLYSIPVDNPSSDSRRLAPGESHTLFNGVRATAIAGTTCSLQITDLTNSIYRLSSSAAVFRTNRSLGFDALTTCTVVSNNNAIAEFTFSNGSLAAVQEGDEMYIKSGGVFGSLNAGAWLVVAVSGLTLSAVRKTGQDFVFGPETTPAFGAGFADEVLVYSSAGVQPGDKVNIAGGFSTVSRRVYQVKQVAPNWIEFVSATALPNQSGIVVGANDVIFYSKSKKILYIEVDQDGVVQMNGETSETNRLTPEKVGDQSMPAYFHKYGDSWSCVVTNRSVNPMNLTWFSGE